jgi:hypothetical protein
VAGVALVVFGHPQHALADDVALDVAGARGDPRPVGLDVVTDPLAVLGAVLPEGGLRAEDVHREVLQVVGELVGDDLENFAVNILGPEAALWEDGPEDGQWVRDYLQTYGSWIAAGTGDIQRNIIGERVLGMPKDDKSQTSHREES